MSLLRLFVLSTSAAILSVAVAAPQPITPITAATSTSALTNRANCNGSDDVCNPPEPLCCNAGCVKCVTYSCQGAEPACTNAIPWNVCCALELGGDGVLRNSNGEAVQLLDA